MRALFGARSERDSRGRCAWLFRREVAWAVLNTNAKLKIERAEFVGRRLGRAHSAGAPCGGGAPRARAATDVCVGVGGVRAP
jgi:hypothetical protein